jgi:hypothetical protein
LSVVLFALAPRVRASAQEPRLATRFPPQTAAALETILDSARALALPTEPLIQRALEGAGRGADPARIVAGVRALTERLVRARDALGPRSTQTELMAGASVLYLGVEPPALSRIRLTESSGDVTLPLVVLADIVERGVPRDTATRVIQSFTEARVPEESYQVLRRSVLLDISAGSPPVASVTARARAILHERPRVGVPKP